MGYVNEPLKTFWRKLLLAAAGLLVFVVLYALCASLFLARAAEAMNNPGPFALQIAGSDFSITTAGTQPGTPVTGFAGINALACKVTLSGAATAGTKINVYVQTSLDQGQTWMDIVNVAFANTPTSQVYNVSALDKVTTAVTPGDGTLADNTAVDGVLGDQFRAKTVSTGTYTGATLVSVRCQAR
jgi:hypothetical protein